MAFTAPEAQLTQVAIAKMKQELPILDQCEVRLSTVRRVARDADRNGSGINEKAAQFPKSLSCSG